MTSLTAPYFEDESVTIYHGDCRELLPLMPKVDLVLTDPPYGIADVWKGGGGHGWGKAKEQGVVRPPKSDEDIQAWADKYPDVAAIVETIAEKKAQEKFSYAEDRLQQIDEMTAEADRNKSLDSIRTAHSDFDDLKESDEFHDWAGEQPKWVQDALYENQDDPRSVVRVIDLYKSDKGMDTKSRKRATKDAAKAVVNKRATKPDTADLDGSFSESQVKKMNDKEFEKNMDAIMESQRTGKFIYDLSGGAR